MPFNQSSAMIFGVGDHDLPRISITRPFCVFFTHLTLSHFFCPSNISSGCFSVLHFPSITSVITSCSSLSLPIICPKKGCLAFTFSFYERSCCVSFSQHFHLISLQSMRSMALCIGNTFLLVHVSFEPVFKMPRLRIHTSKWVPCN